ncbi:hypothetical protein [Streptomyces morookaense]|uniref:Uncharacterized protein n=1 Tax=Streptomyces morookaense TaxID=1970 RepID=A0A7Y7B4I2_STRMO|nr:hypothetical protein [Streptomyces morookaense]NVK78891.1 hypothetical protein [Streptomyces morookaense]
MPVPHERSAADAGQRPTAPGLHEPNAVDADRLPTTPASGEPGRAGTDAYAYVGTGNTGTGTTAPPATRTNHGAAAPPSMHRPTPDTAPTDDRRRPPANRPDSSAPAAQAETRAPSRPGQSAGAPSPSAQPRTSHDTPRHDTHPAEPHPTPRTHPDDNTAPTFRTGPRRIARLSVPEHEAPTRLRQALASLFLLRGSTAEDPPKAGPTSTPRPTNPPQVGPGRPVFRRIAAHAPEPGSRNTGTPATAFAGSTESTVPVPDWGIPQAVLRQDRHQESQNTTTRDGGTGRAHRA